MSAMWTIVDEIRMLWVVPPLAGDGTSAVRGCHVLASASSMLTLIGRDWPLHGIVIRNIRHSSGGAKCKERSLSM